MKDYQASRGCVVCNNTSRVEHYCSMDQLEYVRCTSCGLIYVDHFATDDAMHGAYTGGYLKSLRRRLMAPFRKMRQIKGYTYFTQRAGEIFEFAQQQIQAGPHSTYLDIGCNKGFLLAEAAKRQFNVHGVELVKELIRPFCNTYPQFATQIYSAKFSEVGRKFPSGYFNLISAIDVVEHFEDPLADLQEICRVLANDGAFVIQTPDIACQRALEMRCEWGALKPLEHLHLFDSRNFETLARRAGFASIRVFPAFEEADGNFVAVLKK